MHNKRKTILNCNGMLFTPYQVVKDKYDGTLLVKVWENKHDETKLVQPLQGHFGKILGN